MKLNKLFTTVFFSVVISAISFAQGGFEGIIKMSTTTKEIKDEANINWYVKNGNHKLEITGTADGKPYNTILLFAKNSADVVIITDVTGEKAVHRVSQAELSAGSPLVSGIVSKTDETKTIAGQKSNIVKVLTSAGVTNCAISNQASIASVDFPPSLFANSILKLLRENNITGMPLEIISTDGSGEVTFSQTVTSISETTVSDTEFEVPTANKSFEELVKESFEVE